MKNAMACDYRRGPFRCRFMFLYRKLLLRSTMKEPHKRQHARMGNGFVFDAYDGSAILDAIDRSLTVFRKPAQWTRLMKNAMACNYSWDRSAAAYVNLYRKLLLR